jgi:hypothetical protein
VPAVRETIATVAIALRTERRDIAFSTFCRAVLQSDSPVLHGGYATAQPHGAEPVQTSSVLVNVSRRTAHVRRRGAFLKKKCIRPPALRQKAYSIPSGCESVQRDEDSFFDLS